MTARREGEWWIDENERKALITVGPDGSSGGDSAVSGDVAHDAADTGNPISIGGYAESTVPAAVSDGDRVRGFFDTLGQLAVRVRDSVGASLFPDGAALADATANPTLTKISSFLHIFNGVTWDRLRGDTTNGLDVDVTRLPAFGTIASGEVQGATSETQNPSVACRLICIKARYDNVGRVYIGPDNVTIPDGTTDTTSGIELNPGDEIWLPITNLNLTWRICSNAGDDFTYIAIS